MKDIDKKIEDLKSRTKGKYITQACAFNKECPRQMELLKLALESSASFSGLVKELLALKFNGGTPQNVPSPQFQPMEKPKIKNVGNFL